MDYNWEEIFKEKSNKDLYNIYIGNSMLPKETISFAKKELEDRHFDFDNMEANKTAWKLSKLIDEDDMFETEVSMRKLTKISLKSYLLITFGIVLLFLLLFPDSTTKGLPMSILIMTIIILINNYIYKLRQAGVDKRRNEILELTEKLEKAGQLKNESPIFKDIIHEREKNMESNKTLLWVIGGLILLLTILKIIKNYT
jgi:uncharacterized membrane protein (DUF485 family)